MNGLPQCSTNLCDRPAVVKVPYSHMESERLFCRPCVYAWRRGGHTTFVDGMPEPVELHKDAEGIAQTPDESPRDDDSDDVGDDEVGMAYEAHALFRVEAQDGTRREVTHCMLNRLDSDEIVEGRVPADMPEYGTPVGARCHPEWRDGCEVVNTEQLDRMDKPPHEALVEQAETVLEAVRATMYYPVAHGEAEKLQTMLEQHTVESSDADGDDG